MQVEVKQQEMLPLVVVYKEVVRVFSDDSGWPRYAWTGAVYQ